MSTDLSPVAETLPYRSREEVTQAIIFQRLEKSVSWTAIASVMQLPIVSAVGVCLGQLAISNEEKASALIGYLELHSSAKKWLMLPPYRGTPTDLLLQDPFLQRLFEVFSVYGPALKALSSAEFGDGLISTADFSIDMTRIVNQLGDRVAVTFSGKFEPYESF